MVKKFIAVLGLALALLFASVSFVAAGGYLHKGDPGFVAKICSNLTVLRNVMKSYKNSNMEGNMAWAVALESGECVSLKHGEPAVLGDRMGTLKSPAGDLEVWEVIMKNATFYALFTEGVGSHTEPYDPDKPIVLPELRPAGQQV